MFMTDDGFVCYVLLLKPMHYILWLKLLQGLMHFGQFFTLCGTCLRAAFNYLQHFQKDTAQLQAAFDYFQYFQINKVVDSKFDSNEITAIKEVARCSG